MASGILTGSITWNLDESTGVLTIGGSGVLSSGASNNVPPWGKGNVTKLIVKDGVTAIGLFWFNETKNMKEIEFSDSVAIIGIEDTWDALQGAFYNCTSLEKITFGTGLTQICSQAFNGCSAVKEIYFKGGQPTLSYATYLYTKYYCQFSLGTSITPVTATVFSNGWASDSVFTGGTFQAIRGKNTTFNYVVWIPSSGVEIPVNVSGTWKNATPYVNVNGTWKEVKAVYVNVNGTWKETV